MVQFLSLVLICLPAFSWAIDFQGDFKQGGFVYGQTIPGAVMILDDKEVYLDNAGNFIFGFSRDHPAESTLTIKAPNGSKSVRTFKVTQREYDIQRIDGLPDAKVTPRTKEQKAQIEKEWHLKQAAYKNIKDGLYFTEGFIRPVEGGRISGVYGSQRILNGVPKRPHYGLDIAAPTGTAVKAPASGTVILAQEDMYFEGGTLFIDHGQGLVSIMIHLSRLDVAEGDKVIQGDVIGAVGSTGRSTGPHLHWGLRLRGSVNLDPALLIQK